MDSSAIQQDYDAFCAKMAEILGNNFGPVVPEETKASTAGLRPQHGMVVGCAPSTAFRADLEQRLRNLPSAWQPYSADSLHHTFAAVDHDGIRIDGEGYQRFDIVAPLAMRAAPSGKGAWLTQLRLLVSADTIVLATVPNMAAFALRQFMVVEQGSVLTAAGMKPGWGCHMTLARATRPLLPEEREATDRWLSSGTASLPMNLLVSEVLAGLFVVENGKFVFKDVNTQPLD